MYTAKAGKEIDDGSIFNEQFSVVRQNVDGIGWTHDAMSLQKRSAFVGLEGEVVKLTSGIEAMEIAHNDIAEIADAVKDDRDRCIGRHIRLYE